MKTTLILFSCCSILFLQGPPCQAADLDSLLSKLIIGSWSQKSNPYGIATFSTGGIYEAKLYRSNKQRELLAHLKGTWDIKKGILHNTLTEAEPPLLAIGEDFTDEIVQINGAEMVLIDMQGKKYTNYRLR